MRRRLTPLTFLASVALGLSLSGAVVAQSTAGPAPAPDDSGVGPTVYVGQLSAPQLAELRGAGIDPRDLGTRAGTEAGRVGVEVVLDRRLAAKLVAAGLPLTEKQVDGEDVSSLLAAEAAPTVFRPYSGPGGLAEELVQLTTDEPALTELVTIGSSVQGQPIYAVRVTADARRVRDGSRPAVLYVAAQHAREWITPEMVRRLLHRVVDGYATDPATRRLLRRTELWFVPVANPDGYDFTFTEGNRLWRKNLRDNNGDGQIGSNDGVDLNRNFPYKWGYDNEGSSPSYGSETFRGTAPASEPETRALDGLMRRIGFTHLVNYHSAAELLLYGVGWQVSTRSPDDLVFEAQAGDDAQPAVPGYDPDQGAELYTTNGETDGQAAERYDILAYTPEMSTCQSASALDPADAFESDDCESVFSFPDSEPLVEGEFQRNLPFALSVAQSALDPGDPVSVVGRTAPDFEVDPFTVSYGDPQKVAVLAKRELRGVVLRYSVNGRRAQSARARLWRGGERYGDEGTIYYGEYRGVVRGTRPGDRVRVWFEGIAPRDRSGPRLSRSDAFTYRVAQDRRDQVLVIADEDYDGVNPTYTPPLTGPKYATAYVDALRRAGIRASVWDVSAQGVPHPLGVLDHFRGVVWYQGDNRLTQDPEDEITETYIGDLVDASVAEREQDLTLAVRDFLNEGGKLVDTGETATYYGALESAIGGIWYGLNGDPAAPCELPDPDDECLLLADDFAQYYLGRYVRSTVAAATGFAGSGPLAGLAATYGGPALTANPIDEAGTFAATSSVLPPAQFPDFAGTVAGVHTGTTNGALQPVEGSTYVGGLHVDDSYMRLTRTVDLTGVSAADAPALEAQLSFDVEPGYDSVIVEAHTVGQDDWTTLPESGGLTTTDVPAECEAQFLIDEHPFLTHYLTLGDPCLAQGTSGTWNAMTGSSEGWQPVSFDLSAYAGTQVEVSIAYVTDPAFGAAGVFVDDTRITAGGVVLDREGFESGLGPWTIADPPPGTSPATGRFVRSGALFGAAVATDDTVLLGFGVEQVGSVDERSAILRRAFAAIGVR